MITIHAKRWFQRSYGNTYHSVSVREIMLSPYHKNTIVYNKEIGYIPFRYGYGDHYLNTAAEILGTTETELRHDIRKNDKKYHITVMDVQRKKDL